MEASASKPGPPEDILEVRDNNLDDVLFAFGGKQCKVRAGSRVAGEVGGFGFEVVDRPRLEDGDDRDMAHGGIVGDFDFPGFSPMNARHAATKISIVTIFLMRTSFF